jgi:hypothetical protein
VSVEQSTDALLGLVFLFQSRWPTKRSRIRKNLAWKWRSPSGCISDWVRQKGRNRRRQRIISGATCAEPKESGSDHVCPWWCGSANKRALCLRWGSSLLVCAGDDVGVDRFDVLAFAWRWWSMNRSWCRRKPHRISSALLPNIFYFYLVGKFGLDCFTMSMTGM